MISRNAVATNNENAFNTSILKKRQPRNPGSDLDADRVWRMQGSPNDFRNRSRPSRVMPQVLGALPVRSAARLACPTATSTNTARLNCRRRREVVLIEATISRRA